LKLKLVMLSVVLLTCPLSSGGGSKAPRFTIIEDQPGQPVVLDSVTGLSWQGCTGELSGSNCDLGAIRLRYWIDALSYCQNLTWGGYGDWYLPNVMELRSIVNNRTAAPALDSTIFSATPSDYFWTSTTSVAEGGAKAWRIDFNMGAADDGDKTLEHAVRCVRK
jgi:hypothetical protein